MSGPRLTGHWRSWRWREDLLRASGVKDEEIKVRRLGEMRYVGQGHEVAVELPEGTLGPDDAAEIEERYRQEYRRLYGREGPDVPLETLTWRLEVASPRPQIQHEPRKTVLVRSPRRTRARRIYLPEHEDFRNVPVYDRYRLDPGAAFEGPAVVEERNLPLFLVQMPKSRSTRPGT